MATKAPKSILKTPSDTGTLAADQTAAAKAREVAVTHAKIIHHQRALEDQISDSIIELCKYPLVRDPPYDSGNPAPSDAEAFKNGIRLFQPGDYDDLIEERNCEGLCGYPMCSNPRLRVRGGEWRIVGTNILPKKEVEKWCSQTCAKRAMYVKVQLNETAAWERAGIESIQIELYEEPERRLVKDVNNLQLESQRDAAKMARDLALERGETNQPGQERPVPIEIKENSTVKPVNAPSLDPDQEGHLVLEGHKTKSRTNAQNTPAKTSTGNNSLCFQEGGLGLAAYNGVYTSDI
ncbi:putative RNA polymerase II subunit B1 CTD phosphatase RPAP2-like protein [Seiridium cardinale]|uniref:RNA polymerase II subunit B1 CTD phosphatase RPAP2 homolog n=1 Tax=Seiridium cardinale TaxID=138064 RepID=A0ABR2X9A2_9PEZI